MMCLGGVFTKKNGKKEEFAREEVGSQCRTDNFGKPANESMARACRERAITKARYPG